MENQKFPKYIDVDGFRLPGAYFPKAFQDALQYKPREEDVFIVTYPKCGTTWIQYIVYLIYHKGEYPEYFGEFLKSSPCIILFGVEGILNMSRPGTIKSHLPFHLQPQSPKAKYIYVARNPKDCCVSFYFYTEGTFVYDFSGGKFDDFFELFIQGETDFGDYFDNLLSWYDHRNDPNVLFLTYEDLKKDLAENIRKVAGFLGAEYAKTLEKDQSMMDKIVHCSSFEFMKTKFEDYPKTESHERRKQLILTPAMKHVFSQPGRRNDAPQLVREGIVGNWRSMLSEEQNRRMDAKIDEKLAGTDLLKFWKENNYL